MAICKRTRPTPEVGFYGNTAEKYIELTHPRAKVGPPLSMDKMPRGNFLNNVDKKVNPPFFNPLELDD